MVDRHRSYIKQDAATRRDIITRSYQAILKRAPRVDEQGYWNSRLQQHGETYTEMVDAHRNWLAQNPQPSPSPTPNAYCSRNSSILVAFDGTETNESHKSSIWQVYNRFAGIGGCTHTARYIYGPNIQGSNSGAIFDRMYTDTCGDIQKNDIRKVFVIGFSRGAINAMRFANEFNCSINAKVIFIGVSDPVDALMAGYDSNKQLQAGKAAESYKLVKNSNDRWATDFVNANFDTTAAPGFNKVEKLENSEQSRLNCGNKERHWMMNAHSCVSGKEVEVRFIREMSALGVSFSNVDVSAPADQACSSENGYGRC